MQQYVPMVLLNFYSSQALLYLQPVIDFTLLTCSLYRDMFG